MLTICELNAENLFIALDYYEGGGFEDLSEGDWRRLAVPQLRRKQKPLRKIWGLSTAIKNINPDILMLIEVGGKESLEHFNEHFLNNAFVPYFIESNSNRSIDLAFLVKRGLEYNVHTHSHRQTPIEVKAYQGAYAARFSRDVAELRLSRGEKLELILLLTHLKSKISTDQDFQGKDVRRAEAEALSQLYEKRRREHPDVPLVVGGDLNSELSSPEMERLTQTDLCDFHDLLASPAEKRISLVHFDHKGKAHPQVLDYLLVSPHLQTKIVREKSYTYRYRTFHDIEHPIPNTLSERFQLPSDHYPLVLTLDLQS